MDYFLRAQIETRNADELALLLTFQDSLKHIALKNGTVTRSELGVVHDRFTLLLRTHNPREIRSWYNGLRDMLVQHQMPGSLHWHECRHQDKTEICTWNESFVQLEPGGGR